MKWIRKIAQRSGRVVWVASEGRYTFVAERLATRWNLYCNAADVHGPGVPRIVFSTYTDTLAQAKAHAQRKLDMLREGLKRELSRNSHSRVVD